MSSLTVESPESGFPIQESLSQSFFIDSKSELLSRGRRDLCSFLPAYLPLTDPSPDFSFPPTLSLQERNLLHFKWGNKTAARKPFPYQLVPSVTKKEKPTRPVIVSAAGFCFRGLSVVPRRRCQLPFYLLLPPPKNLPPPSPGINLGVPKLPSLSFGEFGQTSKGSAEGRPGLAK